jgi:hypothetical protein
MLPPQAPQSAPTLPFTRRDVEGLPDLSTEDDERETQIMPTQAIGLSTVGERPVAEPRLGERPVAESQVGGPSSRLVDGMELVGSEDDTAAALADLPKKAPFVAPTFVTDTLLSVEPGPLGPAPKKKRHPPVRVWAAVILMGAALGIAGGALVAKATARLAPTVVVSAVGSDVPSAKGADPNGSEVASATSLANGTGVAESEVATVEVSTAKATRRTPNPRRAPSRKPGKNPAAPGASGLFDSAIQ